MVLSISQCSQGMQQYIGEPIFQIITNWVTTKSTTLGQRGATRDKSTGTEVLNRLYLSRVSLLIPQVSVICQCSTLSKVKFQENSQHENIYISSSTSLCH